MFEPIKCPVNVTLRGGIAWNVCPAVLSRIIICFVDNGDDSKNT